MHLIEPAHHFSVASYNIHKCVGTDKQRNPSRIAHVIKELHADIVGLQEVDSPPGVEREAIQMDYLAHATGLKAVAGPTIHRHDGPYGNVLLTRCPIVKQSCVDLSFKRREPRGAIDATLDVHGKYVRVIVTHFGLSASERRFQAKKILEIISDECEHPIIVLGDINEWFVKGRALRWLHDHFGKCHAPRTFPSFFPMARLDRIWVKPIESLMNVRVHNTRLARIASDHLPIKAMFTLEPKKSAA